MIPRLLVASDQSEFKKFIDTYISENRGFTSHIYSVIPEEGKSITIEQIRNLKKELVISSEKRLVIIHDFQKAKHEAQNALLKTLEDQTVSNQFFICTNNLGAVLPTILSRSQVVMLESDASAQSDISVVQEVINSYFQNPTFSILNHESFQPTTVDDASLLFDQIIRVLRIRVLQGDVVASKLAEYALELKALLRTNNLNPQLSIDSWCLMARKYIN